MVTRARTDVFADLEAQTHRRFIKTRTPLDGIPSDPAVTYICVGRDPRDVGLSVGRHIGNTDIGAFLSQRERAAAIDGIELGPLRPPRPRPGGERDRFWQWADDETPSTQVGSSLRRTVEHLQTFRDAAGISTSCMCTTTTSRPTWRGRCGSWPRASASTSTNTDGPAWSRRRRSSRCASGPARPSPAAVRSTGSIPPRSSAAARAASGVTSSTTPTSPGTPRACGRSLVEWVHREPID
jgi:hypothetical protein